jgi:hypothetical protein
VVGIPNTDIFCSVFGIGISLNFLNTERKIPNMKKKHFSALRALFSASINEKEKLGVAL